MAKNPLGAGLDRAEEPEQDERIVRQPAQTGNAGAAANPGYVDKERSPERTYVSRMEDDRGPMRGDPTAMSEDEIEEFLRNEFTTQVLPACPQIPGYHTCWLSTTNQYDTIPYRMRLGYTPVTADDVPMFRSTTVKTGEYSGMIGVNEMLLFKVPETIYQKLMRIFHHDRPNEEEERLRANLELMQGGELSKGRQLVTEVGDGTEEMLKRGPARAPARFE